jgi:hypothetical protein
MLRALGRILWVPIAAALAGVVALTVLVTLGLEHITRHMHGRIAPEAGFEALVELLSGGIRIATGLTLLPALAVIVVGEVGRIRSALYYVAGGGLALTALPFLARLDALPEPVVWQVFATAGFAGGLAYWLLAGRRA